MHPPFTLTRESTIRIDAEGHVWHDGERIENPRLAQGLAGWIDWDGDAQRWILKNAVHWCFVTLEGTPMTVWTARVLDDEPAVRVTRSDGQEETVSLELLRIDRAGAVYAYVREGTLLARFSRSAAFAVLEGVELVGDALTLSAQGSQIALHELEDGAVPPYRRGAMAASVPTG